MKHPSLIALIPARSGSKRVSGKNTRILGGHPLLAYTISAARGSGVFDQILVSTDSEDTAAIARHYGALAPFLRPASMAQDQSPDIEWVRHALHELKKGGSAFDCFSILRPTSPFRGPKTIQRAWKQFLSHGESIDSLRAVEKCAQHPGKMWVLEGNLMKPLQEGPQGETPWHSRPYQSLPEVYVQNASLEIAWSQAALARNSISGTRIAPFITEGYEGLDINQPQDWWYAEHLISTGQARLPSIGELMEDGSTGSPCPLYLK